jgi:hypothetical protein
MEKLNAVTGSGQKIGEFSIRKLVIFILVIF